MSFYYISVETIRKYKTGKKKLNLEIIIEVQLKSFPHINVETIGKYKKVNKNTHVKNCTSPAN